MFQLVENHPYVSDECLKAVLLHDGRDLQALLEVTAELAIVFNIEQWAQTLRVLASGELCLLIGGRGCLPGGVFVDECDKGLRD